MAALMKQTPAHQVANRDLLALMPRGARHVVEVGCMHGALAAAYRAANPGTRYTGIDIDPDYAAEAAAHCDTALAGDIETFEAQAFDVLFPSDCWVFGDCLEHLRDPWRVVRRIRERISPDGCLVACIPNGQHWSVQMRLATGLFRYEDSGLLDRYANQSVKAVVTWIIPAQLARVTGDGSWLGSSPRYVLESGVLRHTGSFNEYRLFNPIAGARYLLGEQFAFVDAIGRKQRQDEQMELFVAIMARLQQYAREKFDAPLIVIYSWPDEQAKEGSWAGAAMSQPELVSVLSRLRRLGMPLLAVDRLTWMYDVSKLLIPHDGHPNAFSNELIAGELKKRLNGS